MDFNNQQKLIITLLTEIHANLKITDGLDPEFVQRVVNEGHGWALSWKYDGMFNGSDDSPESVKYVADVLEMWSFLEGSYKELDENDQKVLAEKADPFGTHVKFQGFDGNNESEYRSIARIFVNDLDRWSEFEGRDLNSHSPTTDVYRRMLPVFDEIRSKQMSNHDFVFFGVEELAAVLNSQRHPSKR